MPRAPGLAASAAGGHPTIGLRSPAHPVAHALLVAARKLGIPGIAAPSANRFGRVSPTTAAHAIEEFGDDLWVLDGGACRIGIESSIVDCSGDAPVLLRPGMLTRERIEAAAGEALQAPGETAPQAPGTLASHYAPRATVRPMPPTGRCRPRSRCSPGSVSTSGYIPAASPRALPPACGTVACRRGPEQAAHELFSVLRAFDAEGVRLIWVEDPPPGPEWDGVRDRLERTATR